MTFSLRYEELMTGRSHAGHEGGFSLACTVCAQPADSPLTHRCQGCRGAIDAIHRLDQVALGSAGNSLQRYFDLLPIRDRGNVIWLGEGDTPCFTAAELGRRVGLSNLTLKNESENPTHSTKDRIASVGLSRFAELGVKRFVMASTGNSSTAYARGVQLASGIEMALFCGRRFSHRLSYPDHSSVATFLVNGDFVAAGAASRRFAERTGAFFEGGFFNYARREGLKLAYLEAFDQMDEPPEYVFQAVSSGMGLLGAYKGALEYRLLGRLRRLPRFVAVQQASCAPMARAYRDGSDGIRPQHVVTEPQGIAEAILRGDPTQTYPYIRHVCQATGGQIVAVAEEEIRAARTLLQEAEGVRVCYSSATALAGVLRLRRSGDISPDASVLVNLTGGDRVRWPAPTRYQVVDAAWPDGAVSWPDGHAPGVREAACAG
jgi:threonine synthase